MQEPSTILLEDRTSAFIVRVWIEQREVASAPVTWRGSIEHVESGESRYLTDLGDLARFIQPFLIAHGANLAEHTR